MRGKLGLFSRPELRPDGVAGLTGWFDASDSSTLYDSSSGGSAVASDGDVARFEDKSGGGRHFSQSTSSRRPVRKVAVKNGLDVLRFDGAEDRMATSVNVSAFISSTASTVFVVAVASVVSTDNASIWNNDCAICDEFDVHGWFAVRSSGTASVFGYDNNYVSSSGSYAAGNWSVFSARHDGTNLTGRIDGQDFASVAHGTKTFLSAALRLGSGGSGSLWQGDIGEVICYNTALSQEDRNSIESYLRNKWAI